MSHPTILRHNLLTTLAYFARFHYPLTEREILYWLPTRLHPKSYEKFSTLLSSLVRSRAILTHKGFYYLPGYRSAITSRLSREQASLPKVALATRVGETLCRLPTIRAIFITGSLALHAAAPDDDIDLMIITAPHTLWLTRALVVLFLKFRHLRRDPGLPDHSSPRVRDKLCDNLYIDQSHLSISHTPQNRLYLAHEILQAHCIYQSRGVHHQFLRANSWVSRVLPAAYRLSLETASSVSHSTLPLPTLILAIPNLFLFIFQYFYMKPRITTERIGLKQAFFHPRPSAIN